MKKKIVAFDFDGTITKKDTLLEFIRFSKGSFGLWGTFLLFSSLLVLYKLGLYPNWKVKEQIFSFLYKGISRSDFDSLCSCFFQEKGLDLIRKDALEKVFSLQDEGYEVLIISASIENWVVPFANYLKVKNVLATQVEFDRDENLTGHFLNANCFGKEKVNRLLALYPDRKDYELLAFGDSKGDKELLAFADQGFYRLFDK